MRNTYRDGPFVMIAFDGHANIPENQSLRFELGRRSCANPNIADAHL